MIPRWFRRRGDDATRAPAAVPEKVPTAHREADQHIQVAARTGGVGAGRDANCNAVGPNSRVYNRQETHIHQVSPEVEWPLEVGAVPALATAFQPRAALRAQVDAARAQGSAAVLTQVLSGGGGVGKSQLAAAYASEALQDGVDLVVWATAVEVQQVVTLYAQTAALAQIPGTTGENPEEDARALLSWLATTERRWLVVLDDITDPAGMTGWWPSSRTGTGWVLATTRLHDASLTGNGRRRISIDVYNPDEAVTYLRDRLSDDDAEHLLDNGGDELTAALGYLPLALGHAAAYMLNEDLPCTQYLSLFYDETRRLEHLFPETADAEGYGRQVATTLLLSLDVAQKTEPAGLAEPVLGLVAFLDPAGHPHAFWSTPAALTYLTKCRAAAPGTTAGSEPVTAEQVHSVLRVLHRYALLYSDRSQEPRAVRIHALTARAARESPHAEPLPTLTAVAAEALMDIWPEIDQPQPELAAVLRANADYLWQHTEDHLWQPYGRGVLFRVGNSLRNAGLVSAAVAYGERLFVEVKRVLGPEHRDTLMARGNLASFYRSAGRVDEAVALGEAVLVDRERVLGPEHPDTLLARGNLASFYRSAGRVDEVVALGEAVLAGMVRVLGPEHPDTLLARGNLASSYERDGRVDEAVGLGEEVLADMVRVLGPEHPNTFLARGSLASFYRSAGRVDEAVGLGEAVLADMVRVLGPEHPDTLLVRGNLASSYGDAGRVDEAVALGEAVLVDRERVLGPEHPDTFLARGNLATSYWSAGRVDEAVGLGEAVLVDRERVLGPEHPDTFLARGNLASFYRRAGRVDEAVGLGEEVLADMVRVLGSQHPYALLVRGNLATSYGDAGRVDEAVALGEAVLVDRERVLGPEHPDTLTARENLAIYRQGGSW
ncbi:FxSxx-COOH system tetratricopeptide repeat protein [Streptomyces phytohabitans]|uniref:FxSxx-COOH system tetratricopeptide repeat protein n=1 Tax=Streptomyces phytohabitans TaxID=1150371 RepID=UPI00345B9807